ncbi:MAG: hypothetical protein Q9179_007367 [Wetmoreana sp. 5 TL-2023]
MNRVFFRLLRLLHVIYFLFQITTGQLTGSVGALDNHFIISIQISNPTSNTISILAWNNIFDPVTDLPVSFVVRDAQEHEVQLASTYAMRAGMSDSDFHHLAPGDRFQRIFDLRQVLQNLPGAPGRQTSQTITIALQTGFKGISHPGNYAVPAAAAADLTSNPPRLGDFSAAGLQDITLTSHRISLRFDFPIFPANGTGKSSPPDGIHLDSDNCQGQDANSLADALFDAGTYASALSLAADDQSSTVFAAFFNPPARQAVAATASSVKNAINGEGPHVDVYCTDGPDICSSNPNILGYTFTPSWLGNAYIVLCPAARSLPRAPLPCSFNPGIQIGASASHVMFHLILTLNNVVPWIMSGNVYGSGSCQQLKNAWVFDPYKNPDSYAQLAIAQWAYGLGQGGYSGPPCPPADGIVPNVLKRTPRPSEAKSYWKSKLSRRSLAARQFAETNTRIQSSMLARELAGTQQCEGYEKAYIGLAIRNAQALAAGARNYRQAELFRLYAGPNRSDFSIAYEYRYFNGGPDVNNKVRKVFDNIANWYVAISRSLKLHSGLSLVYGLTMLQEHGWRHSGHHHSLRPPSSQCWL